MTDISFIITVKPRAFGDRVAAVAYRPTTEQQ